MRDSLLNHAGSSHDGTTDLVSFAFFGRDYLEVGFEDCQGIGMNRRLG